MHVLLDFAKHGWPPRKISAVVFTTFRQPFREVILFLRTCVSWLMPAQRFVLHSESPACHGPTRLADVFAAVLHGPGLAGWNGYGKGWGQRQSSRSDYSFRSNHKGTGFGASGKGAWPDSSYTWEAGYVAGLQEMEKKRSRKKKPASSSDVTPESTPEKPKN